MLSLGAAILPTADNARRFTAMTIEAIDRGRKWVSVLADQAKSFIKTELAASGLFDRFSKVNDAMLSAIDKGDVGGAFEILLAEMELTFTQFAHGLAVAWMGFVGPFVDDFKNGIVQIKLSLIDVKSFAERQLLGTAFGRRIGMMAAGHKRIFAEIISSESMKRSLEEAFAGFEMAASDPEKMMRALAAANKAEQDRIINERKAAQDADRKERARIIADLQSRIDALNGEQDKRLGNAAGPKSGMEEMKERAARMAEEFKSSFARGGFGLSNLMGAFGTGNVDVKKLPELAKKQLTEAEKANKRLDEIRQAIRDDNRLSFR